jgi:prevent-host-death family protein
MKEVLVVEIIGVRELAERASAIVSGVETTGKPAMVTRHGRPVAVVMPIDEEQLLDYVLANAPEYVRDMREAEREIAAGVRGIPLDDALAELDRLDRESA